MKWLIFLAFALHPSIALASGIYNPGVAVSTSTLPGGATVYIQNTFTPSTTTQVFSVQQGKYAYPGFIMTDANDCTWDTQISTHGAIVTALINCPTSLAGQCMGLLCSITYP